MAKKDEGKIKDYISHFSFAINTLKSLVSKLTQNIQDLIYHTEKKVLQTLFSSLLTMLSVIFLSIAFVMIIYEYLDLGM